MPNVVRMGLLLAVLAAVAASPVSAQATWTPWITDAADDLALAGLPVTTVDSRADLRAVEAKLEAGLLHLRLTSAAAGTATGPPGLQSDLRFRLAAAGDSADVGIRGTDNGITVEEGESELPANAWGVATGSVAWSYAIWIRVTAVLPNAPPDVVSLLSPEASTSIGNPVLGDTATGPGLELRAGQLGSALALGTWSEVAGVDFAGGTSVALEPSGTAHLAYYVYDESRDTAIGVYHATAQRGGIMQATRIGSFQPLAEERDAQARTEIAVDGQQAHVLYLACPGATCTVPWHYTAASNEWADEDPGQGLATSSTDRAKADIAAWDGRVVAALPLDGDKLALVERSDQGWRTLHTLAAARLPKLSLNEHGLHVAFFRFTPDLHDQVDGGDLMYASEAGDWQETKVVSGIIDQTGFWDIEVDGSFGFAVDPDGRPAFVWDRWLARDDDLPERGYGVLGLSGLVAEPAPIEPSHGNPQLAIRLAFDGAGNAHVMSGYGGTDLYAVRTLAGAWLRQDIDRHDVWDFAVDASGLAVVGYTQPHGGTTVAVSFQQPTFAVADDGQPDVPAASGEVNDISTLPALVVMAALMVVLARTRHRA